MQVIKLTYSCGLNLHSFKYYDPGCIPQVLAGGRQHLQSRTTWRRFNERSRLCAAAAAQLLQSCLTLCDPIDGSPPGFPIPGILQTRTLEWVAISFSKVGCIMALKDIRSSLGNVTFSQFSYLSCLVVSDSLQPQGLQHTRLSCPSSTPRACSNSCLLSRWCHPTISSSVTPFFSCLQSFPESRSFPMRQFFISCGQSIRVSALALVLLVYIQDWFPLGLTCLISLLSQGLLRVFSNTTVQKHQLFGAQPFNGSTLISIYDPGKTIALTIWAFVGKVMSLLFNMLSRLVKALLPRSKHLLISWLQSHL